MDHIIPGLGSVSVASWQAVVYFRPSVRSVNRVSSVDLISAWPCLISSRMAFVLALVFLAFWPAFPLGWRSFRY
jgi:hypothetical protein